MDYTNLEQSKELMELGLKPETADLVWCRDNDKSEDWKLRIKDWNVNTDMFSFRNGLVRPAWSTDALLKAIPTEIAVKDVWFKFHLSYKEGYWYAAYRDETFDSIVYRGTWLSLVNILADTMKWLLEDKYKTCSHD